MRQSDPPSAGSVLETRPFLQPVRTVLPLPDGDLPAAASRVSDGRGHEYVATPAGLVVECAVGPHHVLVPADGARCVAPSANGDVWLGTARGAYRWSAGRVDYFASRRWLPDDRVDAIECLPDGSARVWTPEGISHITWRRITLAEKAAHYEALTDARHRRFGFVTGCRLLADGDLSRTQHNIDDNDGLWTAMYVAAQAFRFAVTGSEDARAKARESMQALLELERKTGLPGFPARALTHRSDPQFQNHRGGEWHACADPDWEWKGDTSSDEMDGHYFVWGIYCDLVADDAEKDEIRAVVRRVTDRIIEAGYRLTDLDGLPTRWGVWAPEQLNDDPRWRAERGLNSLEMLSYLRVAHHVTGDPAYHAAYRDLIQTHHYALNALTQKAMPGDFPGAENNHSDDELAFLAYYGLLRYETDAALRRLYLAGLERSWQIERPEKSPLWNAIYGALSGHPCQAEEAIAALQAIPLDLVRWRITNSHRQDLPVDADPGRHGEAQAPAPVPWGERPMHKWNGNPYRLDDGNNRTEECGTFWLLPYWMGRFHGLW